MIKFAIVWLILMLGLVTNEPGFFIVGGVVAVINLLATMNAAVLEPAKPDTSQCPPHQYEKCLTGLACKKCGHRPG